MRDMLLDSVRGIDGWSHAEEIWLLHEAVRLRPEKGSVVALEIGSYEGRTTIALGLGMAARETPGRVVAVDPHGREGQYETFLANLERAKLTKLVDPIRAKSHDARTLIDDGSIDVLFVDGMHEYENVVEDIDDWTPKLGRGAFVGFNDPWLPGVNRALRERICRARTPYRNARFLVNSLFFDYLPDASWTRRDRIQTERLRAFLVAGRTWTRTTQRARGHAPTASLRTRRFVEKLDRRAAAPVLRFLVPTAGVPER